MLSNPWPRYSRSSFKESLWFIRNPHSASFELCYISDFIWNENGTLQKKEAGEQCSFLFQNQSSRVKIIVLPWFGICSHQWQKDIYISHHDIHSQREALLCSEWKRGLGFNSSMQWNVGLSAGAASERLSQCKQGLSRKSKQSLMNRGFLRGYLQRSFVGIRGGRTDSPIRRTESDALGGGISWGSSPVGSLLIAIKASRLV